MMGLNQIILGYDQGKGIACLLGNTFEAPKEDFKEEEVHLDNVISERDFEMTFIHLPSQVAVMKISSGDQHILLLSEDGHIYTYGLATDSTTLGHGTKRNVLDRPKLIESVAERQFLDIACGS